MFFRYNLPALIWGLFILFITLIPGQYVPPISFWDFASWDKLVHLGVFAVLVALCMFGFLKQYRFSVLRFNAATASFLICMPYGLLLEIIQGLWLVDRYFDIYDVVANTIGCVFGIFIYKFVQHKL